MAEPSRVPGSASDVAGGTSLVTETPQGKSAENYKAAEDQVTVQSASVPLIEIAVTVRVVVSSPDPSMT